MISFADAYSDIHGVERIAQVIQIAPSTDHAHVHCRSNPDAAPARVKRDAALKPEIQRVFDKHFGIYGVHEFWRQLQRESFGVACYAAERLMKVMGLQGIVWCHTTP